VCIKDRVSRDRARSLAIRARLIGGFIVIALRAAAIDDDSTKRNKAFPSIYYATLRYVGAVKGNFNSGSRTSESLRRGPLRSIRCRRAGFRSLAHADLLRRSFVAHYA